MHAITATASCGTESAAGTTEVTVVPVDDAATAETTVSGTDVTATSSNDGDGFVFAYSTDGRRWKTLFTVKPGVTGLHSAALDSGTSGDVLILGHWHHPQQGIWCLTP